MNHQYVVVQRRPDVYLGMKAYTNLSPERVAQNAIELAETFSVALANQYKGGPFSLVIGLFVRGDDGLYTQTPQLMAYSGMQQAGVDAVMRAFDDISDAPVAAIPPAPPRKHGHK